MIGTVGILNVGAGDTKLSFDNSKPAEVKRAARVVKDMLERGFAILVEVGRDDKGPLYRRATGFDPDTCEYLIVGAPDEADEETHEETSAQKDGTPGKKGRKARAKATPGKRTTKRVPASKTKAVAVARTAGG